MAKSSKPAKSETKITRISASDSSSKKTVKPAKTAPSAAVKKHTSPEKQSKKTKRTRLNPLAAFWVYIKGSWHELQQVRWPDRRSTWGMTAALIAFTLFFVVIILLLDAGFTELFKLLMGK